MKEKATKGQGIGEEDILSKTKIPATHVAIEARNKLREYAEKGNSEAQFIMGYILGKGSFRGLKPGYKERGRTWYLKAAEQGHPGGQFEQGKYLVNKLQEEKKSISPGLELLTKARELLIEVKRFCQTNPCVIDDI